MSRETQNLVLLALGGGLLKIASTGTYLHYVKPSLQPYLIAGSVLIVVLAGTAIVRDIRARRATGRHEHGRIAWLLVLPMLLILFVPPAPLGLNSVGAARDAGATTFAGRDFAPLPDGDAPELAMLELVQRASAGSTLDDHPITVTGFVVATADGGKPRLDGSREGVDLARVVIICCAADARTLRIHLDDLGYAATPGEWLEIRGTVMPGSATEATGWTPTITVDSARRIDEPANTYSY